MRLRQKMLIAVALLSIGAIMVIGNKLRVPDYFFFWTPWALGAVYAYAQPGGQVDVAGTVLERR